MKAKELIQRYAAKKHVENGIYLEKHYEHKGPERAESGSIYYYVAPGEHTEFHRIDCDEYWCHNAGSTIELWSFDEEGILHKQLLGTTEGSEPVVFFRRGQVFASRLSVDSQDGAFITCITVPRFSYQGFELIERERMLDLYPESEDFWKTIIE